MKGTDAKSLDAGKCYRIFVIVVELVVRRLTGGLVGGLVNTSGRVDDGPVGRCSEVSLISLTLSYQTYDLPTRCVSDGKYTTELVSD